MRLGGPSRVISNDKALRTGECGILLELAVLPQKGSEMVRA